MRQVDGEKPARRIAMLRAATVLAGLGLVGCATDPPVGRPSTPMPGQPVPASAVHRLMAIVERAVKVNDGHGVVWASAVVTTRAKALTSATPGDFVPNDEKTVVYLVTVKGHFVARAASVPPGAHLPTGTYMSMVINAKTFTGLEFGLGPNRRRSPRPASGQRPTSR